MHYAGQVADVFGIPLHPSHHCRCIHVNACINCERDRSLWAGLDSGLIVLHVITDGSWWYSCHPTLGVQTNNNISSKFNKLQMNAATSTHQGMHLHAYRVQGCMENRSPVLNPYSRLTNQQGRGPARDCICIQLDCSYRSLFPWIWFLFQDRSGHPCRATSQPLVHRCATLLTCSFAYFTFSWTQKKKSGKTKSRKLQGRTGIGKKILEITFLFHFFYN